MNFFIVVVVSVSQAFAAPPASGLSVEALREIGRLQDGISTTLTGRRLLAETGQVLRLGVEKPEGIAAVRFRRGREPALEFILPALKTVTEWEFELAWVRESAKASMSLPLELPEEEMAAVQTEMQYAMEKAAGDKPFSQRLRAAFQAADAALKSGVGEGRLRQTSEFERLGLALARFARSPDGFYWAVARGFGPGAVALTELEDFMKLQGPDFGGAQPASEDVYVRVNGRRYPAALLRAAKPLVESGGLERIHEALDSFETKAAPELKRKIEHWAR